MRIGTKLLITYLVLVGLVASSAGLILPRFVERVVMEKEQERLEEQARNIGKQIRSRLGPHSFLDGRVALRLLVEIVDLVVTEEAFVVVDASGKPVRANREELQDLQIPPQSLQALMRRPLFGRAIARQIDGVGSVLIAAVPLEVDAPQLNGGMIVVLRSTTYVEDLARGISRRLNLMLLILLVVALIVSFVVSREMVSRLHKTGEAARSLAEGNLASRAPESGSDEIADLAGHFNHMAERLQALVDGLRRSEESRKALLAVASHEIRTPLTSIRGFAEALRDGVVPTEEKRLRYYEIIATESARLAQLVDDLFDVARLEAGQAELQLQEISVGSWLAEFAEGFLHPDGVPLALQMAPEAAQSRFYGDRSRLHQVLNNLVANAVRFSPPGEPVRLEAAVEADELEVRVIDRGPGLAPEEASRVFRRFYQGAGNGQGHKGAGLGLAIVKSLVEAHGGTVGVISQPGAGATFWFRLKRHLPGMSKGRSPITHQNRD